MYIIKLKDQEVYLFELGFTMGTINKKEMATRFTKKQAEAIVKKNKNYIIIKGN